MRQTSVTRRTKARTDAPVLPLDLFTVECVLEWDEVNRERRMLSIHDANAMRSGQHPRRFFPDCDSITSAGTTLRWRGDQRGIERADRGDMNELLSDVVKIDTDYWPFGRKVSAEESDRVIVDEEVTIQFRDPDDRRTVPLHDLECLASTPDGVWVDQRIDAVLVRVDWEAGTATYHVHFRD
ncbi:MAG: hypothetical protein IT428_06175 [Planctomycetaceae bacterium]|nr:hypothetical protein [Planctomycetaceae bacterium]